MRAWPIAVLCVALFSTTARAAEDEADEKPANKLSYHDNSAEGKRSIAGTGEMVAFTLPDESTKVAGIRIHASRYGSPQPPKENVMIYFLSKDGSEAVATKTVPYSRFKRGEQEWVTIRFPKPVELPKEFWVCTDFRAEQTKGVYVSYDESTGGKYSRVGLPGEEPEKAKIPGDWMIEVLLAK